MSPNNYIRTVESKLFVILAAINAVFLVRRLKFITKTMTLLSTRTPTGFDILYLTMFK